MPVEQAGSRYGFETTTGLTIQQGLFEQKEEAKHNIGTRLQLADGRVFYYARAGASNLAAGKLNFSVATVSGHEDVDTSAQSALDKVVTVTVNTTAVTANQYAEGWISTRQTGGVGQMLKIRSNTATTATTGTSVLTLYDPITTALLATGQADLIRNPFDSVIESATEEQMAAGVPLIPVTAAWYFWNQTWGLASVLSDGAVPLGSMVVPGTVAGSVKELATATNNVQGFDQPIVGQSSILSVDALYTIILLQIHP